MPEYDNWGIVPILVREENNRVPIRRFEGHMINIRSVVAARNTGTNTHRAARDVRRHMCCQVVCDIPFEDIAPVNRYSSKTVGTTTRCERRECGV